jgi:hypothetical protein
MFKNITFSFFFLFFLQLGFAQSPVKPLWNKDFKNSLNSINKACAFKIDKEGNCYVLVQTWMADSTKDIALVKYDTNGAEVWRRLYDNKAHGDDYPASLTIDNYGNIWICGISKSGQQNGDFLITRFSADGIPDVDFNIDGRDHLFDAAGCIAADKLGNVYVGGYTTSIDSGLDLMLVRIRANGTLAWTKKYASVQMDVANALVVDDSCNVYVCGVTNSAQRTSDILLQKYDSTGHQKWQQIYDGIFNERDIGNIITADDSMNIYVSGFVNHTSDRSDLPVLKYTRNGQLVKEAMYNGVSSDCFATSLHAYKDRIYLTGNKVDYNTSSSAGVLLKYNKAGKEKLFMKTKDDFQFLTICTIGHSDLILGTNLTHPESTLIPFIAEVDTMPRYLWTFKDSTVFGLSHIIMADVFHDFVYFLGDDAGDATGTVQVFKYKVEIEADPKKKMINHKPTNKSGLPKNK